MSVGSELGDLRVCTVLITLLVGGHNVGGVFMDKSLNVMFNTIRFDPCVLPLRKRFVTEKEGQKTTFMVKRTASALITFHGRSGSGFFESLGSLGNALDS